MNIDADEAIWMFMHVEDEAVDNAFCPTGKGGGVDPSCGKGKGKAPRKGSHAAAVELAKAKLKSAPKPTDQEISEAKEGLARLGANVYRRNLVGNSKDRAKRRDALLREFGDGSKCPCVYCGTSLTHGTLEQDKIYTTAQGGRYRLPNLVPACSGCNKHRSDKKFSEVIKRVAPGRK